MNSEEWIKDAQEGLDAAAEGIGKQANLAEIWDGLSDDTKRALSSALTSGAIGSALMGGYGAMTAEPGESRIGRLLRYGALGGAGGAVAGGTGRAAYDLLTGGRQFDDEVDASRSLLDATADATAGGLLTHPGLMAGTGVGGALAYKGTQDSLDDLLLNVGKKQRGKYEDLAKKIVQNWKEGRNTEADITRLSGKGVAKGGAGVAESPGMMEAVGRWYRKMRARLPGAHTAAVREAAKKKFSFADPAGGAAITNKALLKRVRPGKGKLALAALPLMMLLGYGADRYIRGDYE